MPAADVVITPDADLCAFMQSVELAVVDAYDRLAQLIGDDRKPMVASFQSHHNDYATALGALTSTASAPAHGPNQALQLVLTARLQSVSDQRGAFNFGFELENDVVTTYSFVLTTVMSPDVVRLVSTIVPVVSAQATVFGTLTGLPTSGLFPGGAFESTTVGDGSDVKLGFDPASFPVS
jgi:hypothetical protein